MALVSLLEREDATPEVQAVFDAGAAQYGRLLHTWQAIAHRPEIMTVYMPYLRAVAGPGVVDQRIKELTAVEVSLLNHCRYSTSHRVKAARAAGVEDEDLQALADERYEHFSERERTALKIARELTVNPPVTPTAESEQAVAAETLAEVRDQFSEPEVVELTLNISLWNLLSRFHRVMQFDYDIGEVPDYLEKRL